MFITLTTHTSSINQLLSFCLPPFNFHLPSRLATSFLASVTSHPRCLPLPLPLLPSGHCFLHLDSAYSAILIGNKPRHHFPNLDVLLRILTLNVTSRPIGISNVLDWCNRLPPLDTDLLGHHTARALFQTPSSDYLLRHWWSSRYCYMVGFN